MKKIILLISSILIILLMACNDKVSIEDNHPIDIGGKVFVWEREYYEGGFYISFAKDGTYSYIDGRYEGNGEWEYKNSVLSLYEKTGNQKEFHFSINGEDLVFIYDGSSQFLHKKVEDGDVFKMLNKGAEDKKISILGLKNTVYPYIDDVYNYLSNPGTDVLQYMRMRYTNQQKAITINFECTLENADRFQLYLSTDEDFKDSTVINLSKDDRNYDLFNLYKATKYFVKLEAYNKDGESIGEDSSWFLTADLGPRFINVDGIHNVRDLGGYITSYGRTRQGLLYRGGTLTLFDGYISNITEKGKTQIEEELKIKSELDLRSFEEVGISETSIPGATLYYLTIDGYESAFSPYYSEAYRRVFSFLANKDNYPVYMHCTGGADRTGTVAFLLNAFLGASEIELIQDYELTSFSIFGQRNIRGDSILPVHFQDFYRGLNNYPGESLQEKTENYLLSIGVTSEELNNIRKIFL